MALVHRRIVHPSMVLAALFLVMGIGAAAPASSVMAQDGPPVTTFTITVLLCIEPGCTEFIEDTAPAAGVAIDVGHPDTGVSLGSCVTGSSGSCTLDVEWFSNVLMTFDEGTIPDGYALNSSQEQWFNGDEYQAETSASVLIFPEGGFPEPTAVPPTQAPDVTPTQAPGDPEPTAPVSQLPSTGSGSVAGSAHLVIVGSAFLAMALGLVSLRSRKVIGRGQASSHN